MKWNNPGNIRSSKIQWIGKVGDTNPNNPAKSFVIFDTIQNGYRAHIKNLQAYIGRKIDTLTLIINTWAPRQDNNDPPVYINTVSKLTGINPDQKIQKNDLDTLAKLAYAMSIVEKGNEARTPEAKKAAIDAANALKKNTAAPGTVKKFPFLLIFLAIAAIGYGISRKN